MAPDEDVKLPGFGMPLSLMRTWLGSGDMQRFPHAIADFYATKGTTRREQRMLDFINQVTDKPNWQTKVYDEGILLRWRREACGNEEQQETSHSHLSQKCFDYCMQELHDKATYFQDHGVVHVLDIAATIVKSDMTHDDDFCAALNEAVIPLETVPEIHKDWHPGSDGLVLDLVHPSLYPLQYGKSRVLPRGKVDMLRCSEYSGRGTVCPVPAEVDADFNRKISWSNESTLRPWGSFQWLPSEISFRDDRTAKIDSYINQLHPSTHGNLYRVLEAAVEKAIPLWNECLSFFHDRTRIVIDQCGWEDFRPPMLSPREQGDEMDQDDDDDDAFVMDEEDRARQWLADHPEDRILLQPDPTQDYIPLNERVRGAGILARRRDLRTDFPDGLQVIFKLANIHLTPEKPEYTGSSWHVEGALNEHICATALFYYDQENITDSYLEFRHHVDAEEMVSRPAQDEWAAAEALYGIENEGSAVQDIGKVLTRQGRMLAFPNVMQHRVRPFGLADPTRPGHRKILAMFLVDPHIRILSTANVPPQQRHWWAEEVRKTDPFAALPVELHDRIIESVDDFPIGWDEACQMREALMAERGRMTEQYDQVLAEDTFFFCEH